jgi:hypothetical protein
MFAHDPKLCNPTTALEFAPSQTQNQSWHYRGWRADSFLPELTEDLKLSCLVENGEFPFAY